MDTERVDGGQDENNLAGWEGVAEMADKAEEIAKIFPNATIFGSKGEVLYRPAISEETNETKGER